MELYPWAKALNINEKTLSAWQQQAGRQPLLEWCLNHHKIADADYLAWATDHYLMPSLSPEYFTSEFDVRFFNKVRLLADWTEYLYPVGAWDGVLFIACAIPPESVDVFCPYRLVLAPPQVMAKNWHQIQGTESATVVRSSPRTPNAEKIQQIEAPLLADLSEAIPADPKVIESATTVTHMPEPPPTRLAQNTAANEVVPAAMAPSVATMGQGEPSIPLELKGDEENEVVDWPTDEEESAEATPEEESDELGALQIDVSQMNSALDSIDFGEIPSINSPTKKATQPQTNSVPSGAVLMDLTPEASTTYELELDTSAQTVAAPARPALSIAEEPGLPELEFDIPTPGPQKKSASAAKPSLNSNLSGEEIDKILELESNKAKAPAPNMPPPPPTRPRELKNMTSDSVESASTRSALAQPTRTTPLTGEDDKTLVVEEIPDTDQAALAMLQDVLGQKATMKSLDPVVTHQYDYELDHLISEMVTENKVDASEIETVDLSRDQIDEEAVAVGHTITNLDELSLISEEQGDNLVGGDEFHFDFDPTAALREPRVLELDKATTQEDLGQIALNIMNKYFKQNMILLFQQGNLVVWKWDENWAPKSPAHEQPIDLRTPSIFRIAHRSNLPYHGYIVPNDTNNRFFNTWNRYQLPNHITIVPLARGKNQIGMLLGASQDQNDKDLTLEISLELAEKFSANLIRVAGANKTTAATSA